MFKLTKGGSGARRAGGGGAPQSGRISGLHGLRGAVHPRRYGRGAFMPDTPEESNFDSSTSRVSEPGENKQGWTGKGIGG